MLFRSVSLWTFAGGDPQKHAQSLLQATAKSLAGAETPVEAVELGTPGGARAGIRARVATKAGNIARHVEAYGFTAGGKAAVLLWIGAPEDFATPEAAGSALRTQIARTLQVAD